MNTKTQTAEQITGTDLVVAPGRELVSNFPTAEQISELVALTRAEAKRAAAKFDVNTATGRLNIISVSVTVRDKKVKLRKAADASKIEHQDIIKEINEGKKTVEDEFQEVQDEIRKPVTDWETADKARIQRHKEALEGLGIFGYSSDNASADIQNEIDVIERIKIDDSWQEFKGDAAILKDATLESLRNFLDLATRREAMEKELAERRAKDIEREKLEAYEAMQVEAEAENKAIDEAVAFAERERLERYDAAQVEAEAENVAFNERVQLAKERAYDAMRAQADHDNQAFDNHKAEVADAAQRATKAAEENAKRLQGIEQTRRDNERRKRDEEQAKRDQNKRRRTKARNEILAALTNKTRAEVAEMLMNNEVPHVTLSL